MKLRHILTTLVIISFAVMASSCVTSDTTVTAPDGTVTRSVIKAPDAASINAASNMAGVASRFIIRDEK